MNDNWLQNLGLAAGAIASVVSLGGISLVLYFCYRLISSMGRQISEMNETNRILRADGESAQATILDVRRTGTLINDNPIVKIILQIQPINRPAYQTEVKTIISEFKISLVQVGTIVPVKIDRSNPQRAALDFDVS